MKSLQLAFDTVTNYAKYSDDEKIEVIKECIDGGIDINQNSSEILIKAIQNNKIVNFLIDMKIDIRVNNDNALVMACEFERIEIIKLLLREGANASA